MWTLNKTENRKLFNKHGRSYSPEWAVIQSHRFGGPEIFGEDNPTASAPSWTTFTGPNPLRLTVREFTVFFAEEPLEEESEEHELSTETLFRTAGSGISEARFRCRCGLFGFSAFRFSSSETLSLFPARPSMARGSETGLADNWSLVATDIAVQSVALEKKVPF